MVSRRVIRSQVQLAFPRLIISQSFEEMVKGQIVRTFAPTSSIVGRIKIDQLHAIRTLKCVVSADNFVGLAVIHYSGVVLGDIPAKEFLEWTLPSRFVPETTFDLACPYVEIHAMKKIKRTLGEASRED